MRSWILVALCILGCSSNKAGDAKGSAAPAGSGSAAVPVTPKRMTGPAEREPPDALPALVKPEGPGPAYFVVRGKGVMKLEGGVFRPAFTLPDGQDRYVRLLAPTVKGTLLTEGVGEIFEIVDGKPRLVVKASPSMLASGLTPAPDGTLWTWSISTVNHFDGKAWTSTNSDELGKNGFVGFAIASDSTVWLAAQKGLYKRDGATWIPVAIPAMGTALFEDLVATSDGRVVALTSSGLIEVTAATPELIALPRGSAYGVKAAAGPERRIALVAFHGETMVYAPPAFATYDAGKDLVGGRDQIAMDGAGRVWIAGKNGLLVLDASGTPTHFPPGTLEALSGTISAIVIEGGGPTLPAVGEVARGRVKGVVSTKGGKAIPNAKIELCASPSIVVRGNETPCSKELYQQRTTTNADGEFVFEGVPIGVWSFAVLRMDKAKWSVTMRDFCSDTKKGETCNAPIPLDDR